MLRRLALCLHMLAGMLDVCVSRPGCHGRAYACLRLYAFDRDGVPVWPACTRWIVEANRQRHQRTVNGFTIWCLNSLHKYWHYRTCCSFVSFLANTMNLQYSYSTAKRTRDFFEMIVRYINVLLLLLLLMLLSPHLNPSQIDQILGLPPWRDGRLSWPRHLVTYQGGSSAHIHSPIQVLTRLGVE